MNPLQSLTCSPMTTQTNLGDKLIHIMPTDLQNIVFDFLDSSDIVRVSCVCLMFRNFQIIPVSISFSSVSQLRLFELFLNNRTEQKRKRISHLNLKINFSEENEIVLIWMQRLELILTLLPGLAHLYIPLLFGPGQLYSCKGDWTRIRIHGHAEILNAWIMERTGEYMKSPMVLKYKGTRDGFSGFNFHLQCDHVSRLLVIIETVSGYFFGGFSVVPFASSRSVRVDAQAFLFTLINPHGIAPILFPAKKDLGGLWDCDAENYLACYSRAGPQSGDLWLRDECNVNGGGSFLGYGYEDTLGMKGSIFAGGHDFQNWFEFEPIREVLAFQV